MARIGNITRRKKNEAEEGEKKEKGKKYTKVTKQTESMLLLKLIFIPKVVTPQTFAVKQRQQWDNGTMG